MSHNGTKPDSVTTSFVVKNSILEAFKKRVPRYGDRSKTLSRMLEMFLNGEITVVFPARKI